MKNDRFLVCVIAAVMLAISCDGLSPVESVSLNESAVTMVVGESVRLEATVLPATVIALENLVWASSDPSVASVDESGLVIALKEGDAVISASIGGKSARCVITVTADGIEVVSLALDKTQLELTVGSKATLVAVVQPEEAAGRVLTWTSSDPSVATVSNGTVNAIKAGKTVITVAIDDMSASCNVTVIEGNSEVEDLGGGEHEGTTEEDIIN